MDQDDYPLSQSHVSLKLADIQRRCTELLDDNDGLDGLALEEPGPEADTNNPYNRG